jgi:hypothetical protein
VYQAPEELVSLDDAEYGTLMLYESCTSPFADTPSAELSVDLVHKKLLYNARLVLLFQWTV